jgi:mono/diheme cytochrome c family protein
MRRRIGGFAVLSWLIVAVPLGAQTRPLGAATSRDVAAGQQIFDAQCAWCHGAAGTGGTGPDLRRSTLRHATNDLTLVEIVRNGIPGTEMPSFAIALTDNMAWQPSAISHDRR